MPVIGPLRPTDSASDYQGFRHRRPLQLRAVQLHPDAARALSAASSTSSRSSATNVNLVGQGRSTTAAIRRTRRRRCRCSSAPTPATAICSTRSSSTRPTRSTRSASRSDAGATYAFIGRRVDRRRAAPLQPEGRHDLRHRHARRQVRRRRPRLVLGHQRASPAATRPSRRCSATSTPPTCSRRSGRSPIAPAPCVPFKSSAARLDHPGDARLHRLHPARQQQAETVGRQRQSVGRAVRPARRAARPRRRRSSIASSRAASIPIRSSPPASARTFRRCRPRAATTSTKPMPRSARRCSPTGRSSNCSNSTARCASPIIRPRARRRPSRPALNWKPFADLRLARLLVARLPRADHRRTVRHAVALRPGDRSIPARRDQNPTGQILANCAAQGVPAGYVQNNPQISVITGGNENLKPETSKGWNSARSTARASFRASRSRPIITTSRSRTRSRHRCRRRPCSSCVINARSDRLRRWSPAPRRARSPIIQGLLQQHRRRSRPKDSTSTWPIARRQMSWGTLGLTFNNTFLFNYDVIVPTADRDRRRSAAKAPSRAAPTRPSRSIRRSRILDWDGDQFRRLADRPLHQERDGKPERQQAQQPPLHRLSCAGIRPTSTKISASRSASTICSTRTRRAASAAASTTTIRAPTTSRAAISTRRATVKM